MIENLCNYLKRFVIANIWEDESIAEQARAIFSTICLVGNIDTDTARADRILYDLYYDSGIKDIMAFDEFENFMYEYLV